MAEGLGDSAATSSAGGGSFEGGLADGGFPSSNLGILQEGDDTMATWNNASVVDSCDNNVDEVVCPYATFQLSRDQQQQLDQQRVIISTIPSYRST